MQQQQTISRLYSDMTKSGFYKTIGNANSVVGPRRSSKAFPKAKLATKKVTVWWSAASLIHYSFLNPSEIITSEKYAQQINEMHRKLQCLQLALVNRKDPIPHTVQDHTSHNKLLQKLNELSFEVLFHPPYSSDLSPTDFRFFKHLNNIFQGKCFHN